MVKVRSLEMLLTLAKKEGETDATVKGKWIVSYLPCQNQTSPKKVVLKFYVTPEVNMVLSTKITSCQEKLSKPHTALQEWTTLPPLCCSPPAISLRSSGAFEDS